MLRPRPGALVVGAITMIACTWWLLDSTGPKPSTGHASAPSGGQDLREPRESTLRAQVERDETRTSEPPDRSSPRDPVAVTSSQPHLTLSGYLEDRFAAKRWGPGLYARTQSGHKSAHEVHRSVFANPDGKRLSAEQWTRLEELVDSCTREREPVYDHLWSLRKEAMIRAARRGNVEAESYGRPASMRPADLRQHNDRGEDASAAVAARLAQRLGVDLAEIRFTTTATSQPDGVSKQVITWFTKDEEPQFFAAEAADRALEERHSRAFREFFRGIR
jgi:hypothetical protein